MIDYNKLVDMSIVDIDTLMKEKGISNINQIEDVKDFIKVLGIENEGYIRIYCGNNTLTRGWIEVTLRKELNYGIKLAFKFTIENNYKKLVDVRYGRISDIQSTSCPKYYEKEFNVFDSRPEYNNIELYYNVDNIDVNTPMSYYYNDILNIREKANPHIKTALDYFESGSFHHDFLTYVGFVYEEKRSVSDIGLFDLMVNNLGDYNLTDLVVYFFYSRGKKLEEIKDFEKLREDALKEAKETRRVEELLKEFKQIKEDFMKKHNLSSL